MRSAGDIKNMRLLALDGWARTHYKSESWTSKEFLKAMEEYALIQWAVSTPQAKNMARIIQLRLTRKAPARILDEQIEKMSVTEMIAAERAANPSEYAVPTTDFPIQEE